MFTFLLLSALLTPVNAYLPYILPSAGKTKCPILLDGRVPNIAPNTPEIFDRPNTIFDPDYTKGDGLLWSDILQFPDIASRFDSKQYIAVEVTISDASIFHNQTGFRRAGLLFAEDKPYDASDRGIVTLHFSVKQDPTRPLNLSHEYLNVWHETADYSANQIQFQVGTLLDDPSSLKNHFKILDRHGKILWRFPLVTEVWQNFAITLNYESNTLALYYSTGKAELERVAENLKADLSGGGQFQIGILKKSTGTSNSEYSGYQESHINEGQIYGGLFVENSEKGCVSL